MSMIRRWKKWLGVVALVVMMGGLTGQFVQAEVFQWAGMNGTFDLGLGAFYGAQGVADAANRPGVRQSAVSWTNDSGVLWLFGGYGADNTGNSGHLNDLWQYDPATGSWTWMKGSDARNQAGVYGALSTPDDDNAPGARQDAVSWTDSSGLLWLFGGEGYDGAGNLGRLNDLWQYDPATGNWTWMKGSDIQNQVGVHGLLEMPDDDNAPGARQDAVSWTDSSGLLWLFGGEGYDGAGNLGRLNDLWQYDPATGNWTWMQGGDERNLSGIYGTLETPDDDNTPGARQGAVSCTDGSGGLWLFGGEGYDGAGNVGRLNDLWRYDAATGQWTWMHGSNVRDSFGVYGTQGLAQEENTPGARKGTVSWADSSGALWLFGGYGYDSMGNLGSLGDLWRYNLTTGEWIWMKGSDARNQSGVYGTFGIADQSNTPGGRERAVSWVDNAGDLWLFGGEGYDGAGALAGRLNDLWRYNPATGDWTWMKGASTRLPRLFGAYGSQGVPDEANMPGARSGAVSWTSSDGRLWLFGGAGYDEAGRWGDLNDLWQYDPATGQWTWMDGSNIRYQVGTYGTPGVPDENNTPGSRSGAVSWMDNEGAFWLFGGEGYDKNGNAGHLNDLWHYNPATGNWTWMKGSNTRYQAGIYGTRGTPDVNNTPGSRFGAVSWTDSAGTLWLFGGEGYDSNGSPGPLNDLWHYNPEAGDWTWMKGSIEVLQYGIYGAQGTPDQNNTPGSRHRGVSWVDKAGNLWLFGGDGRAGSGNSGRLNDLWRYTPASGDWTWMDGSNMQNQPGVYGTLGMPHPVSTPGARYGAVSWIDSRGTLWLLGGEGYDSGGNSGYLNDLWQYNPASGNWTWMKGGTVQNRFGVCGAAQILHPDNTPGARGGAIAWTNGAGALWLLGGYGYDCGNYLTYLGDLWKGVPPPPPPNVPTNPGATAISVDTITWTWQDDADDESGFKVYAGVGDAAPDSVTHVTAADVESWQQTGLDTNTQHAMQAAATSENGDSEKTETFIAWTQIEPMEGLVFPSVLSRSISVSPANKFSNLNAGLSGLRFENVTNATDSGWQQTDTSWDSVNLTPNTLYVFNGESRNGAGIPTEFTEASQYTLAAIPVAPVVTNPTSVTLAISIGTGDGNPIQTLYALMRSPAEPGNGWIQADGSMGAAPVWQTRSDWNLTTVTGLVEYTEYAFTAVARNGEGVETTMGPPASQRTLDVTPPTGSVLINNGEAYTTAIGVTLALAWEDGTGSGVNTMRFSNNGTTWSAWLPVVSEYTTWTLDSVDGIKTVRVQYQDKSGNISAQISDTILLDRTPPTGSVLINDGETYTNTTEVTLTLVWADGIGSGVDTMRFSNNGTTWSGWIPVESEHPWALDSANGLKTVRVQYQDKAGNLSAQISDTILLDTAPPTVFGIEPVADAENVSINQQVRIVFSEPVIEETLNEISVTLWQDISPVTGVVTYEAASVTVTFTPANSLSYEKTYTVRVSTDVTDLAGNALVSEYTSHFTTRQMPLEGDVAPRPDGDGALLVNDWVQVGRFVAGLDQISSESEFQRADSAPAQTAGDGALLVNDWVQAGRYVAGLDTPREQGGPSTPAKDVRTP